MKRVHVLDLGLGAKLGLAALAHGHVGVHAHRALLHVAVGDAEGEPDSAQLLREAARLLGRADVGLAHELHERRAGAVEVDERVGGAGEAALGAADVDHLAGVLFEVDARDADAGGVGVLGVVDDVEAPSRAIEALATPSPSTSMSRWPFSQNGRSYWEIW